MQQPREAAAGDSTERRARRAEVCGDARRNTCLT